MSVATQSRQPAGAPTGGQFATTGRPEAPIGDLLAERRAAPFVPYGGEHDGYAATKGVTEGQVEDFTHNACGVLAAEMSRRTGWPVVVVGADPESSEIGWFHAGVKRPDGRIVDVEGCWDESNWVDQHAELVDAYGQDEHEDWDSDCVWAYDAAEKFGATLEKLDASAPEGDHAASARAVADVLVAQFASGD